MCGITGYVNFATTLSAPEEVLRKMANQIRRRGPDDGGVWFCKQTGVGLGHRRLSIIDLSPEGHQPMHSASGRYVISYNGEVYNFPDLRKDLEQHGHRFRGHSDTEIILAAFEEWGLEAALEKFVGMFAFALHDRERRVLHLVRDRLGIKPLYFGTCNGDFVFGSELAAIKAHPGFDLTIDRDALASMLRYLYVPAPLSIYEDLHKLEPGTVLSLNLDSRDPSAYRISRYWSGAAVARRGIETPISGTVDDAIDELQALITDAVRIRMVSDVPLGAFLSGGIDSSLVVALMQSQSDTPVRTFTIGFTEAEFNEARHAKAVAHHLGCDHTEFYLQPDDAIEVIPMLPDLYDEPFADSSQIPTYLVSKITRNEVTVALSGDGGDELFCGYNRYPQAAAQWSRTQRMPAAIRETASAAMRVSGTLANSGLAKIMLGDKRYATVRARLANAVDKLETDDRRQLYRRLMSQWTFPSEVVPGSLERQIALDDNEKFPEFESFTDQMMCADLLNYLPDDILTKVDRASMGVSLEARVPLLDHRVVELAWRLPTSIRGLNKEPKWPIKQLLYKHVPQELFDRRKQGFALPIANWLRGPLRDWAESLLSDQLLRSDGYFDTDAVRRTWSEHLTGGVKRSSHLWAVLMFQAWLHSPNGARD